MVFTISLLCFSGIAGGGRSYLIIVNRHRYRGLSCRLGEGRRYRGRAPARQPGHIMEVGVDGGGDKEL